MSAPSVFEVPFMKNECRTLNLRIMNGVISLWFSSSKIRVYSIEPSYYEWSRQYMTLLYCNTSAKYWVLLLWVGSSVYDASLTTYEYTVMNLQVMSGAISRWRSFKTNTSKQHCMSEVTSVYNVPVMKFDCRALSPSPHIMRSAVYDVPLMM